MNRLICEIKLFKKLDCKYIPFYPNRKTRSPFFLEKRIFHPFVCTFAENFVWMENGKISKVLIDWYHGVKRELPWRDISDPYRIWISEIILQQTRVAQGLDYYHRFIERFPNIQVLAQSSEDEVLKYWQGLGYYSRARNLHAAARDIWEHRKGVFPDQYKEVLALKGVGEYTAAAICSFAYQQPYATVDGNVYRVLSRLFDLDLAIDSTGGKKYFAGLAQEILSKKDPATHNQAMMEFGAVFCTPKNPACEECPLQEQCLSFGNKTVLQRPVKLQKAEVKNRYFNYFRIRLGENIFLNKRTGNDIWKNLYEFPLIETVEKMDFDQLSQTGDFQKMFQDIPNVHFQLKKMDVMHVLSHRRILTNYYEAEISQVNGFLLNYLCIPEKDFENYAISRLTHLLVGDAG